MRKFIIMLLSLVSASCVQAQSDSGQRLTLGQCRKLAHDNYPALRQFDIIGQSGEFTLSNISKGWLPKVSFSGGATAFTDIVSSDSKFAQFGADIKNYALGGIVSVTQCVYDGGQLSSQKRVAEAQTKSRQRQLEMELYEINERVDQLYFSVLLLERKLELNNLLLGDIDVAAKTVGSMQNNGLASKGDVEAVDLERLKAQQQRSLLEAQFAACKRMLGIFCATEIDQLAGVDDAITVAVESQSPYKESPANSYYSSVDAVLVAQKRSIDAKLMPTVSVFGNAMLHNRVSSFLNDGLLVGGITLSWNIGALYTRRNDLRQLRLQRNANEVQRQTFQFNNSLKQEETNGAIAAAEKLLSADRAIIELQESQLCRTEKKVTGGTESVAELTRCINALSSARQQEALHEIQLKQEQCRLNIIKGN